MAGAFSTAFSSAFDTSAAPTPPPEWRSQSVCYPADTDWSCRFPDLEELITAQNDPVMGPKMQLAEAFAWSMLASLTMYRIATCPVTVRPCAARCVPEGSYRTAVVGRGSAGFTPYLSGGRWFNACGCRPGGCSCEVLPEVILPGPVGSIVAVYLDGVLVPRTSYMVFNGNRLTRVDGGTWPACQDMSLSDADGFSVVYYRGAAPNVMTRSAAGVLANEYLLACDGDEACRLPSNVTRASRGGESYEFEAQDFPEGKTGLPQVDAVIRIYNPNNLRSPVIVASPDTIDAMVPTWR